MRIQSEPRRNVMYLSRTLHHSSAHLFELPHVGGRLALEAIVAHLVLAHGDARLDHVVLKFCVFPANVENLQSD